MFLIEIIVVAITAFFLGSFPTGYLVGRARGIDIRKTGSQSIGATNVVRSISLWMGRSVFVIDVLKSFVPTLLAPHLFKQIDAGTLQIVACFSAILGHNFTPWLGFRGGKGIAVSMGGFLAICWPAQVFAGVVWLIVFYAWRYVSLASLASSLSLPVFIFLLTGNMKMTVFAIVVAAAAIERHRDNIKRLRTGSEFKFKKREQSLCVGQ